VWKGLSCAMGKEAPAENLRERSFKRTQRFSQLHLPKGSF